nr:hypothetical protein [Halorussus amylolyticus]
MRYIGLGVDCDDDFGGDRLHEVGPTGEDAGDLGTSNRFPAAEREEVRPGVGKRLQVHNRGQLGGGVHDD